MSVTRCPDSSLGCGLRGERRRSSVTRARFETNTFETPRLDPGASVSPVSAYTRPSVRTPSAGPWSARSESCSPGLPESSRSSRTTCTRARPIAASTWTCAYLPEPRSRSVESRWSSRPPSPARTTIRAGRSSRAASSASSRSVASFSVGCRSICTPEDSAAATAVGDAESKSPTAVVTSRPSASACSSPLVRGDHRCAERHAERGLGIGRIPACHDHHYLIRHVFLRWHYPDQVLRVGGALSRPLSPVAPSSPYAAAPW